MQNPFSDFKTNEMPIEKIQEYFTSPKYIDRIYTPNAMFITGQRGSGKTMFMRYVENNPRIVDNKVEYVGIYYRFDRLIYGSRIFNLMDYELFLHHLIIALMKQLVNCISRLCDRYGKSLEDFSGLSSVICSAFFDKNTKCSSFKELGQYLENQRLSTMYYVRNSKTSDPPIICDYSSCLQNIVEQLHKETWLSNVTLLFLLDEYENINAKQRQAVNGLIKASSYGYTFKVFHRPARIDTQVLDSDEHLMVQHDIMVTDFYDEIIGGDAYYSDFMTQIVAKRLKLYYDAHHISYNPNDLNIENYLVPITINQEFEEFQKRKNITKRITSSISKVLGYDDENAIAFAKSLSNDVFRLRLFQSMLEKNIVRIYGEQNRRLVVETIIDDFVNESKKYRGWVANYKQAVLYLLCFENKYKKQTAGWDTIINISKGITRHVINILHYTFEYGFSNEKEVFRKFLPEEQTNAVYTVAEKLYDDIIRVPVVGRYELSLIQYLGRLYQICHQDSTIKKWEVNHFVISKKNEASQNSEISEAVDRVLDAAVTWGHLLKRKATKAKHKHELQADLSEYQLHPLLSVYFSISWRSKQRFDTTYEEIFVAAYGEEERRNSFSKTAKRILNNSSNQISTDVDMQQMWLELDPLSKDIDGE